MIEATEIQAQGDLFDFLRIIDDEFLERVASDEIGSGSNFSLHSRNPLDSIVQSEIETKEKS